MSDVIHYAASDAVAVITFNRPDQLNAWTLEMNDGYLAALDQVSTDPEVRAVVVTGAGRGFCAGADMSLLQEISGGEPLEGISDRPPYLMEPAVPKPVIAAINGACAGLGLVRALYCDLRVAVRGAKITTSFARRGLVAEYGSSWLLPRIVGLPTALDLLMTGRTLLAEEALEIGLVDRLVDEDAVGAAVDYARSDEQPRGCGRPGGGADACVLRGPGSRRGHCQLPRGSGPAVPSAVLTLTPRMAHEWAPDTTNGPSVGR
jgi:enoyl-CoA hydratase/carnithine racemase